MQQLYGTIVARARKVTDGMFLAAARALAGCVTDDLLRLGSVYPSIDQVRTCSHVVAKAVVHRAIEEGVADPVEGLDETLDASMWEPRYLPYRPA